MDSRQNRLDVCTFVYRLPSTGSLEAVVIMHLGDFLISATPIGLERFKLTMSIFQVGDLMPLTVQSPIIYLELICPLIQTVQSEFRRLISSRV